MSRILAQVLAEFEPHTQGVIAGVVVGTVTNTKDDEGLNRVKVQLPWISNGNESPWARVVTPMAGNDRGVYFLPDHGDEVLVMFEHGHPDHPYVIGALWNGTDKPPATNADGENNVRVIKSKRGHIIRLNDKRGEETLEIIDASGNNSIVINTKDNSITITSEKDITLAAPKGKVRISAQTIEIEATDNGSSKPLKPKPDPGGIVVTAGGAMTVHATDDLAVQGKTVNINC